MLSWCMEDGWKYTKTKEQVVQYTLQLCKTKIFTWKTCDRAVFGTSCKRVGPWDRIIVHDFLSNNSCCLCCTFLSLSLSPLLGYIIYWGKFKILLHVLVLRFLSSQVLLNVTSEVSWSLTDVMYMVSKDEIVVAATKPIEVWCWRAILAPKQSKT